MINKIFNFLSNHNVTNQIVTQNNYSAEIKTLLSSIDGYFNEGKILQAMDLLHSAIDEHKHKESKYALLIKKAGYLLEMRNIDESIKILNSLKKNYSDYIDIAYKEHMLFIYSIQQQKEKYFSLIEDIKIEKKDIQSNDYLKMLYGINNNNVNESKKLFNLLNDNEKEKEYLIGGHIFASSYHETMSIYDLENAEKYYQKALNDKPHFLLKFHIVGFFVQNTINESLSNGNQFNKNQIIDYQKLLSTLFEAKEYFNKNYINELINFNASVLWTLEYKDEYIKCYEENEVMLFNNHYLRYCETKQIKLNHSKVQKKLSENDTLLIQYASLMLKPNEQKNVLHYFTTNINLLFKTDLLVYMYIKGAISLKYEIIDKVSEKLNKDKIKNYDLYLSYLLMKHYNQDNITQNNINILLNFVKDESLMYYKITNTIDFLEKIKQSKQYINFAISKVKIFENLINYILNKCLHDKELKLNDVDLFIKNIDNLQFAPNIAEIYLKYGKLNQSFEYFEKAWDNEKSINNARSLLFVGNKYYKQFKNRLKRDTENEALFFLLTQRKELNFHDIGLVSYYSLVINEDGNKAFEVMNKTMLSLNVYELDNTEKQNISSIYFNSLINSKNKNDYLFEENTTFLKDDIYYLDKNIFEDVHNVYLDKLPVKLVNTIKIQKIKLDSTYEKKSLFHVIANQIMDTINSPHFTMGEVDTSSNNPLGEIQELLIKQNKAQKNQFKEYSAGADIGFWSLVGSYDRYFSLIDTLINNNEINFNSCHINYKDIKVPKLLTLSSIIFLNYHNHLDNVLKKEDVYIQKSTRDWLYQYMEELNNQDEIFNIFAEDGQLHKNITNKEQIEIFSNRLKEIIINIDEKTIIDDTQATLPLKGASSLSKNIGVQEYQALSFSFQENYQIITEDRIFEKLFEIFKFNQSMISNSLALIDKNNLLDMSIKLHEQKYKYVLEFNVLDNLVFMLQKSNIVGKVSKKDMEIINIMNDYKWLEGLKKYYQETYAVLYPKRYIPQENYFSMNIKYLLDSL